MMFKEKKIQNEKNRTKMIPIFIDINADLLSRSRYRKLEKDKKKEKKI